MTLRLDHFVLPAHPKPAPVLLAFALLAAAGVAPAHAQWTVIDLHPAGATGSACMSVRGGVQGGFYRIAVASRACTWEGSAASFADRHPAGAVSSMVRDVGEGVLGGTLHLPQGAPEEAAVWSGSGVTRLHAAGMWQSSLSAVHGEQQVGFCLLSQSGGGSGPGLASLWAGTPGSWVNLHPAGYSNSFANGIRGGQQVGSASMNNGITQQACLWHGTAASHTSLHPEGAGGGASSSAHDTDGVHQVGRVTPAGGSDRAAMWSGTAQSYMDMHPAGYASSYISAIGDGAGGTGGEFQAGTVTTSAGHRRAGVWRGTAASFEELPMPGAPAWPHTVALSISTHNGMLLVAGYIAETNLSSPNVRALLWMRPLPPGVCYANCDGSAIEPVLNVDDFTCFINEFATAQALPHAQQVGHYANCDESTIAPVLNVDDFTCFINAFAAGCP